MFRPVSAFNMAGPQLEPNDVHVGHSVGLSNPQLDQGRRKMLDLVNRLHKIGAQLDIDIPQIAVIGAQSAGKSSLIESISGITLPRGSGTCTRCPTECRLTRKDSRWQCTVSLRFTTDAHGQPLAEAKTEQFGDVIYDKAEVEGRIWRAQRAILNPSKAIEDFLRDDVHSSGNQPRRSELTFSHNCVSLQISGPEVADLSFCDLPGLISSISSDEDQGDVQLVTNLVTSYIKKPRCIILLTIACETDFGIQGAHRLAKEHDPEGKRTIGVLTKPDRIPLGEADRWVSFIQNKRESLEDNWFCVKQPSSHESKGIMTWEDARQMEEDFFSANSPWCELDPIYQRYLCTRNLVDRLSRVLSDLMSKRVPEIRMEIDRIIRETKDEIASLPREPRNGYTIFTLVKEFTNDLARHIRGVPDDPNTDSLGLIQSIRPGQENFRRAIRKTAPRFRPFGRCDDGIKHLRKPLFFVQEESGDTDGDMSEENDEPVSPSTGAIDQYSDFSNVRKRKFSQITQNKIYIDDILERANRVRTRETTGRLPFEVEKYLIQSIVKQWKEPAMEFCAIVHKTVNGHVTNLIAKHFSEFGSLKHRVQHITDAHMDRCMQDCQQQIELYLSHEMQPFTVNNAYIEKYRQKFFAYYFSAWDQADLSSDDEIGDRGNDIMVPPTPNTHPKQGGRRNARVVVDDWNPPRTAKSPMESVKPVLDIMASVRAYFQVAYRRFVDNVPMGVDFALVKGVERGLHEALVDGLVIDGPDGEQFVRSLAAEGPCVTESCNTLMNKCKRLEAAIEELS
ncbi:hypothetical protein CVT24_004200 [Panaeolus cyanescens]|uniref:GED domain-containing protein n=1 Tax=Panaeolus cyanescens TaxID=181874 RepID=A0A409WVY1_9AGAR|nr:hypothetical protein CVT24_004200 [Panaeolus cyanescens]